MRRREFLAATGTALAGLRGRIEAAQGPGERNLKWAVSMFLWTSTQWGGRSPARFTDMLDVIRDTGFDGFRLTGWPQSLKTYGLEAGLLERELSKRNLRLATMSWGGQASDPAEHPKLEASAHEACKFLKNFGSDLLTVFSPRRPNKVLVRHQMEIACRFWNRLGELCAAYGIRAGQHNHSQGQLVESQDEIELMLKLTDPKKLYWSPDTIHLYMAGCDILGLFNKYAHRLASLDLVDGRYEFAARDLLLPNGALEKAGTHNATFMLSNRDYGDGEVDLVGIVKILKKHRFKGWITIDHHYTPVSPLHSFSRCRKYIRERLEPVYR